MTSENLESWKLLFPLFNKTYLKLGRQFNKIYGVMVLAFNFIICGSKAYIAIFLKALKGVDNLGFTKGIILILIWVMVRG